MKENENEYKEEKKQKIYREIKSYITIAFGAYQLLQNSCECAENSNPTPCCQ